MKHTPAKIIYKKIFIPFVMKSSLICVGTIALFFIIIVAPVHATLVSPKWQKGDYWVYDAEQQGYPLGKMQMVINGTKNITVNGTSYEVWKIDILMNITLKGRSKIVNYTIYQQISDFARVKVESDYYENIYIPPTNDTDYPVDVGDSWERHYKKVSTLFLLNGTSNQTETVDEYYECIKRKSISTPAGKFLCYWIKQHTGNTSNYRIYYYAPAVGNWVKLEDYGDGEMKASMELIEFKYENGGEIEDANSSPAFEISLLILSISIILILKKVRRNR